MSFTGPAITVLWIWTDDAPVAVTGPPMEANVGPYGVSTPKTNSPSVPTWTGPPKVTGRAFVKSANTAPGPTAKGPERLSDPASINSADPAPKVTGLPTITVPTTKQNVLGGIVRDEYVPLAMKPGVVRDEPVHV
jgi:hypothetical protein